MIGYNAKHWKLKYPVYYAEMLYDVRIIACSDITRIRDKKDWFECRPVESHYFTQIAHKSQLFRTIKSAKAYLLKQVKEQYDLDVKKIKEIRE